MIDKELQIELAKRLPEWIKNQHFNGRGVPVLETAFYGGPPPDSDEVVWRKTKKPVQDTEWLHVCHLIELKMTTNEKLFYRELLREFVLKTDEPKRELTLVASATWQQRAETITKVMPL